MIFYLLIFFSLFLALIIFLFIKLKVRRYRAIKLWDRPQEITYEFIDRDFVRNLTFDPLRDNLEPFGRFFIHAKVSSIYTIHGTFVGDDPFHIIGLIENIFPRFNSNFIQKIREGTKKGQNLFAKDLGNFIDEHLDLLSSMSLGRIPVRNFTWSSGNNHFARIKGVISLILELSIKHKKGDRVLLVGHSHAGQLFALLTQFCHKLEMVAEILKILPDGIVPPDFMKKLILVNSLKLDFVTLGTPARYTWKLGSDMRLLHIINHRGSSVLGGDFAGASFTKTGDYIQQWGIAGSDLKSPVSIENQINLKLDNILGVGSNFDELKKTINKRNRLHSEGHHLLVDYGDNSRLPNFGQTIFGHGCYTKVENLQFLVSQITRRFYE